MVKDLKPKPTSFPRPVPKKDDPADGKGNRLTLRMHPDIMELLSARAHEQGVSRSHLVEQILVGFMRLDPRNPKMDAVGRIIDGAETPLALYDKPLQLAARWQKFTEAHTLVIGTRPVPTSWKTGRGTGTRRRMPLESPTRRRPSRRERNAADGRGAACGTRDDTTLGTSF
ncbi:hypothetical protein ACTGJ9_018405 [Bradyrhizobium sp. RDM12]